MSRRRRKRNVRRNEVRKDDLMDAEPFRTLDLHGATRAEASAKFEDFLATWQRKASGAVVHVITGRGVGSDGTPVLKGLVADLLRNRLAVYVSESEPDLDGGGYLIRLK